MKKILIVEDDVGIGNMEEEALLRAGYGVLRAYSGTEALLILERERPDLVLLDLMLPGICGEELLSRFADIPVIVVSAKGAVTDRVALLRAGAADYLTKPFDLSELLARVEVQLRRTVGNGLTVGELNLSEDTHSVAVKGKTVRLTRTEYAILKLLMRNPGQVLAKPTILDRVSADTPDCTESSLKTHISHLRAKLREAGGKEYIEAVWGIGFRLI